MLDKDIIKLYKEGYSIDYIADKYYKYQNRDYKRIFLNGVYLYPSKLYKKSDSKLYVMKVIYSYILKVNRF